MCEKLTVKILLSASTRHFNPANGKVRIRHSVGVLVELFYQVLTEFGDITYIDSADTFSGQEFDLIVSWPRNFDFLTRNNKHRKSICFFNIAESSYLKRVLTEEAGRLGCKVSDCFTPQNYYHADLNFLIGGSQVAKQYIDKGVDPQKIVDVAYRHGFIPYKKTPKNDKPVFIHVATTLGLRKGFWHVVKDFQKADIDAKLFFVGKLQNERFWIDFAEGVKKDPRIQILGWLPNSSRGYAEAVHSADFIVFPSFGEGQPGSVIESMEAGLLPMTTPESGIPYRPLGWYQRGDVSIWHKAFNMSQEDYLKEQNIMAQYVSSNHNNANFKETVREAIRRLMK